MNQPFAIGFRLKKSNGWMYFYGENEYIDFLIVLKWKAIYIAAKVQLSAVVWNNAKKCQNITPIVLPFW